MAGGRRAEVWQAWQERLERYRIAATTVAEFCRRERVSLPSFYQWRRKLARGSRTPRPSPRFVELTIGEQRAAASDRAGVAGQPDIEIRLPNGASVRLAGQDAALLRTAILAAGEIGASSRTGAAPC